MRRSCFPFHPLSLAFVGGVCVQKLLLCYLFTSKFPFTSLLLHLLLFILWNSSVRKSWFISIYLLAPSFIYTNMDSRRVFLSFGWKIKYYYCFFLHPNCSSFGWELFQLAPVLSIFSQALVFWHDSIFLFEYFLTFWHHTMFQAHLTFSLPQSQNQPFSQRFGNSFPGFPLLESGGKIEKSRSGCWVCLWLLGVEVDVAASGPSQLIALLKKKKRNIGLPRWSSG